MRNCRRRRKRSQRRKQAEERGTENFSAFQLCSPYDIIIEKEEGTDVLFLKQRGNFL